jgi:aryl-alcohol dehydrogenase-like predicted oxidoreductase/spore coat polysaccharide biosynthesis protein SpsF (cytidylyltransferase family)
VLQARFNSARLPGKALLPVGELPMVVLAAKRAMRDGADLVVATSRDRSDDAIVEVCGTARISVFRGSLDNVYERFVGATADLDDDATVVRLTADNVFPDAEFIQSLVNRLHDMNVPYLCPRWPEDGLPYGVVAEAFRVGALRRAVPENEGDTEHVTPALRRNAGNPGFSAGTRLSDLRATVDTPDDYSRALQVFSDQADPVGAGWLELCQDLEKLPVPRVPWIRKAGGFQSQLTLGTAQLGMPYGVANASGMPSADEVARIIHGAIDHGVTHIDTAQLYGESESRIGAALAGKWQSRVEVITKLRPIETEDAGAARLETEQSVTRSLEALRVDRIETLLLHRAVNRSTAGGAVWDTLLDLGRKGLLGRLGISVQDRDEFDRAVSDPNVQLIQMPFNLLDRRWDNAVVRRENLTIHARSVFLQGLLTGVPASRWPQVAGLNATALIGELDELARELGRNIADLAVAFVRAQSWIDSLVIGVETLAQLSENLERFAMSPLSPEEVETVKRRLPILPDALVNPAQWRFQ